MDGQFICWKGADLRLPDWRRREIAVLLEQETIATILAYNLFPPGKVDQVAAFFPPKQSEIYAEFRDPFSPPKWTVLDMRVTDSSSLADRRWDFEKGYWPTCLPEIMMGRPTGKPSEGGQLPSEIMAMQMKILCLIFLLLWPLYFFMMPLYHAPAILTRMRNLNFEQTRLTLLSDNEIYEGHFARFWACWRRSAILFLLALFAGSLLILASGGIHTRVLWQDFWIDERMPSILRPNVSTIFSVFICAGAPMIAFISLSLCVMRWRQWLLRALVSVAVPAAYFATRALLVVALGPMVKVAQDLPRIRYIHSDTLRSVGMIVVSLIALALWTWLFSRTLRWTRRNFARQDFSS
ncbi:MAG: hypothetical protein NTX50_17180 [Candidatus Sumerlaeota bacterium]|nr:hypothetical protein [Candidatus Sumerlaeota bacterium]